METSNRRSRGMPGRSPGCCAARGWRRPPLHHLMDARIRAARILPEGLGTGEVVEGPLAPKSLCERGLGSWLSARSRVPPSVGALEE